MRAAAEQLVHELRAAGRRGARSCRARAATRGPAAPRRAPRRQAARPRGATPTAAATACGISSGVRAAAPARRAERRRGSARAAAPPPRSRGASCRPRPARRASAAARAAAARATSPSSASRPMNAVGSNGQLAAGERGAALPRPRPPARPAGRGALAARGAPAPSTPRRGPPGSSGPVYSAAAARPAAASPERSASPAAARNASASIHGRRARPRRPGSSQRIRRRTDARATCSAWWRLLAAAAGSRSGHSAAISCSRCSRCPGASASSFTSVRALRSRHGRVLGPPRSRRGAGSRGGLSTWPRCRAAYLSAIGRRLSFIVGVSSSPPGSQSPSTSVKRLIVSGRESVAFARVDGLLHGGAHALVAGERREVAVDALARRPGGRVVGVEHEQRGVVAAAVADHARLADQGRGALQRRLDVRRRHVLAAPR